MSGGGMPELGSKISLISKADIRYEGRLYTVDPQECTIALSSVRSFGTEDRETQFQIAPQSQIYDYILFRGSDIKDIRVINNSLPHPNDPAIMQVQLPNGQHVMPHFSMPSLNPQQVPPMGTTGTYGNPFGTMGGLGAIGGASGTGAVASLAPGAGAPGPFMMGGNQQPVPPQQKPPQGQPPQTQQKQPISVIDMLAGASRSTTPISLISRKSPSADIGVQVNQQQQQQQQSHQPQQHQQQQHHHNNQNQHHQQQQQHHPNHQNNAGHGGGGQSRDAGHKRQNHQNHQNHPNHLNQRGGNQQRNNDNSYRPGRMMDSYVNNYNNPRGNNQGHQNRNNWNMHRGNNMPNNINNNMRNRGGGPRGGNIRNIMGFRSAGGPGGMQKPSRNPIKFEQDFDFEQANTKFEELRSQLSKLKVGDEPKSEQCSSPTPTTSQMNGETDKKDDSGNETGAGEHEPEEEEISVGYDKTKSFFDNISCETAQDRAKNKNYDWRQERKLNSETFGVSSTRRGGYRGRGNYYNNRNMGGYNNGGGYNNRGYRGNNYRNRSNNRSKMHNNRDGSTLNGNTNNMGGATNNPTINNTAATNLKNQTQQPSTPGSASNATSATSSKTMSSGLQETNNQPQMAAVGAGQ